MRPRHPSFHWECTPSISDLFAQDIRAAGHFLDDFLTRWGIFTAADSAKPSRAVIGLMCCSKQVCFVLEKRTFHALFPQQSFWESLKRLVQKEVSELTTRAQAGKDYIFQRRSMDSFTMASSPARHNHSSHGNGPAEHGRGRGKENGRSYLPGLSSQPIRVLSHPIHDPRTSASIENTEYVTSYNLVGHDGKAMVVPGSPPIWTNRAVPFTLRPDVQTPAASSALPLIMKAVDAIGKQVDWPAIDFVTDRNNLRKLLRWARGLTGKSHDFRIDMELAGERTVLFNIFGAHKYAGGDTGYKHSFERGTTAPVPGCEDSIGHCRIVKYDFFGLKIMVRFEVDACLPSDERATQVDDPEDPLATLDVASETAPPEGIRIIRAGSEVPQQSLIDLKATKCSKNVIWSELFPMLYLSQTPHFYVGLHENGTFSEVRRENMLEMEEQRNNAEAHLRKLGQTLEMIQELVIAHGTETHLSLVCQSGVLSVYERVSRESCLPTDILARFDTA